MSDFRINANGIEDGGIQCDDTNRYHFATNLGSSIPAQSQNGSPPFFSFVGTEIPADEKFGHSNSTLILKF
jgi:hypothetical protein